MIRQVNIYDEKDLRRRIRVVAAIHGQTATEYTTEKLLEAIRAEEAIYLSHEDIEIE